MELSLKLGVIGSRRRNSFNDKKKLKHFIIKAKEIYKKTGKKEIGFRIKHKNQNKNIPFLGRLIYGDKEIFEKKFYF